MSTTVQRHNNQRDYAEIFGPVLSPACFGLPDAFTESGWIEHAPFAFWLVQALRPKVFVELGTHHGYSYLAFCQAVNSLGADTLCYAVDTWKGDEHAGFYGSDVLEGLKQYHDARYARFSTLVPMTFDEAVECFEDGSIDLLHIDGRHFVGDVTHDFETWSPKLSDRAVVAFHDTNVRERGFGVYKFWEGVKPLYSHFEFLHGHGLGVLGFGKSLPSALRELFAASADAALSAQIREAYSRLGSALTDRQTVSQQQHEIAERRAQLASVVADNDVLKSELNSSRTECGNVQMESLQRSVEIERLQSELSQSICRTDNLSVELSQSMGRIDDLSVELSQRSREIEELRSELSRKDEERLALTKRLHELIQSTSWRMTAGLRHGCDRFPILRSWLRQVASVVRAKNDAGR